MDDFTKRVVAQRLRGVARMAEWMKHPDYAAKDLIGQMNIAQGNQILIYVKDIAMALDLTNDVFSDKESEEIFKLEQNHPSNKKGIKFECE